MMRWSALAFLIVGSLSGALSAGAQSPEPSKHARARWKTDWTQMSLPFSDVQDVVIDPRLEMLVYARRPSGVYISWDLGEHFTRSLHEPTELIAIDPNQGTAWSGRDSWQFTDTSGLLWGPRESTIRVGSTLAIAPGNSEVRWTSRPSWGVVFRSLDGGLNWQATRGTPGRCCSQLVALSEDDVYAFSELGSFHRSFDGGVSWAYGTRFPGVVQPVMFAVDMLDPDVLYAVSYAHAHGGLSKSIDGGRTWFKPSARFESRRASAVAVSEADERVYVVETRTEGPGFRVHVSDDGGVKFSVATSGLELSRIRRVVPHPTLPCVAFAVTDRGIFRTMNAGGTCAPDPS
jgi:photosystem II stability/assembly factor-like uncharacterized protein